MLGFCAISVLSNLYRKSLKWNNIFLIKKTDLDIIIDIQKEILLYKLYNFYKFYPDQYKFLTFNILDIIIEGYWYSKRNTILQNYIIFKDIFLKFDVVDKLQNENCISS